MSDETTKTEVTDTLEIQDRSFTQAEVDRLISQRLEREKNKYTDYEAIKKEAETLRQKIKEREEAELTELEKIKKQHEEVLAELDKHKSNTEWRMEWETKESEAIEKEMEELDDDQKDIINSLPLEKRRTAIQKFKAASHNPAPDNTKGKGKIDGIPTLDEVTALRQRFGAHSGEYRAAYIKYRNARNKE